MSGGHDIMSGDHDVMSGDHDTMSGDHDVMSRDHDVMSGDHDIMLGDHDVMTSCQEITTSFSQVRRSGYKQHLCPIGRELSTKEGIHEVHLAHDVDQVQELTEDELVHVQVVAVEVSRNEVDNLKSVKYNLI